MAQTLSAGSFRRVAQGTSGRKNLRGAEGTSGGGGARHPDPSDCGEAKKAEEEEVEDVGDSWMTPRRCLDLAPVPVAAVKKVSEDEDEDVGCLWKKRGGCVLSMRAFIRSSSVCCVDCARVLVHARQSFGGSGLRELACSLFSKMSLDRRLRLQHNPGVIRRAMGLQRRYTILSLFFRLCVPQTFFGHRR